MMKRIGAFIKRVFVSDGRLRPYVLPAVLLVLAIGMTAWGGIALSRALATYDYNKVEISKKPEDLGIEEVQMERPEGITNIALFGIDSRSVGFSGLSDSLMIVTIDAEHNDIKLTSILRDSLVKVEGHGHQKINAAYALGGPQLAIKTLNQTFNLDIRDYATVNFGTMADIIDFVGGVEVELTKREVVLANEMVYEIHESHGSELKYIEGAGVQTLTGTQAVAFARIRKTATIKGTNDDTGRTERQRLVMEQLFERALSMDISKYPALIRTLLPCMETSLTYGEIFKLAGILTSEGLTFKEAKIPATEALISYGLNVKGLGSCKYYNLDYAADLLNAFIFEDISFEDYMKENGVDRTPWFTGTVITPKPEVTPEPEPEEEEPTVEEEGAPEESPETPPEDEPVVEEDPPVTEEPSEPDEEPEVENDPPVTEEPEDTPAVDQPEDETPEQTEE